MIKATVKANLVKIILSLLLTSLVIWLQFTRHEVVSSLMQRLENLAYDVRYRHTLTYKTFKDVPIVIVDIDEKSLRAIGRWPWPRKLIAELNDKIVDSKATVIGYDIILSEPQQNIVEPVLDYLWQAKQIPTALDQTTIENAKTYFDEDELLRKSLSRSEVVLGFLLHNEKLNVGELPAPITAVDKFDSLNILIANNYTTSLPEFQRAAIASGFTIAIRDKGGVVRQAPIVMQYAGKVYSSFSLEVARAYLLANSISLKTEKINQRDTLDAVKLDEIKIPTNAMGQALIPFRGEKGSFPYISAVDILAGKNTVELADKIVLVGTSALGLSDLHATAIQAVFPGIEVHANVIAGILAENFPVKPAWAPGANLFQLIVVGLILAFLLPLLGPIAILTVATLSLLLVVAVNIWLWLKLGLVLAVISPVLLVVLLLLFNASYGYLFESRKKRQITQMFGQYVSSDVVEEMSADPENYNFDGQTRQMTVLFADIRGFTTLAESLQATKLKNLLNRFFSPMTKIIFNQSGTIDKYVGDMIMAFWGAPKVDPKQANNAVLAALQMLAKTQELHPALVKEGLPALNIGIGINTGEMHVGDMGSKYRRSYTVLGDAVNLGSRLEGLTKIYGVRMIIGEETFNQLEGIVCRKLDLVKVKGKQQAVAIYQPLGLAGEIGQEQLEELKQYNLALKYYFDCEFAEAKQIFQQLTVKQPDDALYSLYLARVESLEKNPPPQNWDGSSVINEK